MRGAKKLILNIIIIASAVSLFSGCSIEKYSIRIFADNNSAKLNDANTNIVSNKDEKDYYTEALNYSDKENWAYYGIGENKEADLFIVCPTVDMGYKNNYNMSMSDEEVRGYFIGELNMEKGIYEKNTCIYAPFYRQVSFPVYNLKSEQTDQYFKIAYADVREAFLYYMENLNNGRPLVLAGFSQGSDMILRLLKEFYNNEEYSRNLVAAYCIGWRITEDDISEYPWLKMAEGRNDTGVIISFNSEAEGIKESLLIPSGTKTLGVNPLNWKTDGTFAYSSENKGACFTDYGGNIVKEINNFSGAYLDEKRGSLIVTDVNPADYRNSLFPDGIYHLYDYQFFYRNLQENVTDRIEAFKTKNHK